MKQKHFEALPTVMAESPDVQAAVGDVRHETCAQVRAASALSCNRAEASELPGQRVCVDASPLDDARAWL